MCFNDYKGPLRSGMFMGRRMFNGTAKTDLRALQRVKRTGQENVAAGHVPGDGFGIPEPAHWDTGT